MCVPSCGLGQVPAPTSVHYGEEFEEKEAHSYCLRRRDIVDNVDTITPFAALAFWGLSLEHQRFVSKSKAGAGGGCCKNGRE